MCLLEEEETGDCEEYPDSVDCNDPDGFYNNDSLGDTLYSNITNPIVDQVTGFYNSSGREDIWRDDWLWHVKRCFSYNCTCRGW